MKKIVNPPLRGVIIIDNPKSMDKELLYRYIQCRTTQEEEARILVWLESDPANRKTLSAMYGRMETLTLLDARIGDLYSASRMRASRRRRLLRWSAAVAAAVVLCAGAVHFTASHYRTTFGRQETVLAAQDAPVRYTLGDGTTVWLNAGATLECPAVFTGHERVVGITGEAMFDVRHDEDHPFVVRTAACDVRVLGTKFNVLADAAGATFEAALLRGRIEVVNRTTHERIVLAADESVSLENGALVPGRIADADDYLWTDGYINLKGHSFGELISTFGRAFAVKIDTTALPMPEGRYKWGKIRIADGIDNALKVLQNSYAFDYTFDSDARLVVLRPHK